jgi:hypothetical protein
MIESKVYSRAVFGRARRVKVRGIMADRQLAFDAAA